MTTPKDHGLKVFSSNSVSFIGLDIGSYSIKCVEILRAGQTTQLRRVSIFPTPSGNPRELEKILKIMFLPLEGRLNRLRISVSSGSSLLMRRVRLPLMTAAELKGAIVFEAEGHIPFPVEECLLDFQILSQDAPNKSMEVMLVAAKKVFIQERLKPLADIGVTPEIVDVDMFCLLNTFETLGDDEGQAVYGILNVGHQNSSFAIVHEKQPFFVREIPTGAVEVTRALAEAKGISEPEADKLKTEQPSGEAEALLSATRRGLETLVDEMRHSIDFFENETGQELKKIWMSGGGALSFQAPVVLSEELGRQVALWDNTKKMGVFGEIDRAYLSENSLVLNVSLGMALRGLEVKK
jgi:type IV pilus assembly protein PilM